MDSIIQDSKIRVLEGQVRALEDKIRMLEAEMITKSTIAESIEEAIRDGRL